MIDDHRPRRGPGHWDWRCTVCDAAVKDHVALPVYLWRRFYGWACDYHARWYGLA